MKLWDCSDDFLTLIIRAENRQRAKELALPVIREYGDALYPSEYSDAEILDEMLPFEIPDSGEKVLIRADGSE